MIKSLTVTNHLGESLTMDLMNPVKSGLIIKNISGIGPGKANINTSEIATMDGSFFNSSRVQARNIVLTFALLFSPTIEDARQRTYKYFPIKKQVRLAFETDNRKAEIYGYIESNEPTIFSEKETVQISIMCPDPYFYSAGGLESTVFSGIEPEFEFPFSNESTTECLLEFSEIKSDYVGIVNYDGDADAGMLLTIRLLGEVGNISMYNEDTLETMTIDVEKVMLVTGYTLEIGDELIISTVKGDKFAVFHRNGIYVNIINCIDKEADWFQLRKGENIFVYTATSGIDNLEFKAEYRLTYEGV